MLRSVFFILISSFLLVANTIVCCTLLLPFAILKFLIPATGIQRMMTVCVVSIGELWTSFNGFFMEKLGLLQVETQGHVPEGRRSSYLIWSNHQSWVDILVLQAVFGGKIPLLRFFIKKELAWVPFMNLAWWALDFPFMRRYTKEEVAKDPRRKGADLRTTKEACEKFRHSPVSLLNFLEGTRFTSEKRDRQKAPYRNLLIPKSGGVTLVMQAMGERFESVLDVTIFYPKGPGTFTDLLAGRVGRVLIQVDRLDVPPELRGGSMSSSEIYRDRVALWIAAIWRQKDETLERLQEKN